MATAAWVVAPVAIAISAPGSATAGLPPVPTTYSNPLSPLDTPDPDVVNVDGTYYAFSTGDGLHNVSEMHTSNLADWPSSPLDPAFSDALPCTLGKLPTCWMSSWGEHTTQHAPWAPSMIPANGAFYLFYAAWDPFVSHYCIGVALSSSPAGPYIDHTSAPIVCQTSLGGSIDPSAYVGLEGNYYLVWKNNDGFGSSAPATLWASQITFSAVGVQLIGTTVPLLTQDQAWETTIENPFMVVMNNRYLLLFSGGPWDSANYAIGYASCNGPLGPCTEPLATPIFESQGAVAGPGAPSVFADQAGHLWMAYHAWTAGKIGYPQGARSLRMDAFCMLGSTLLILGPSTGPQTLSPTCPSTEAEGYQLVGADGGLFSYAATFYGSMGGQHLNAPVVGMAATFDGGGYWEVGSDGGIFAFGDAPFYGSMGGQHLNAPVVGMAATFDGGGYWEVGADGGIYSFGDATFYGSMGGQHLNAPVVAMAASPTGSGYWMVGSDGGVYAFGSAHFMGSMGGQHLNAPVVAMAATAHGLGYWEVGADGGIFAFGDAPFNGSAGGLHLNAPVVGMTPVPT